MIYVKIFNFAIIGSRQQNYDNLIIIYKQSHFSHYSYYLSLYITTTLSYSYLVQDISSNDTMYLLYVSFSLF